MVFQENNKAIYLQLADRLCDDIVKGVYPDDERIPSVREYAASVEVNANTVMRTYDYLQQNGVIYNKRGLGFFVTPGASSKISEERMNQFINSEMKQVFSRLKLLGISPERLMEMYAKFCKTE